jgi:N-acetylmuramoyl-L-alanine amidase
LIALFPGHVGKDPGAVGKTSSGFYYVESVVTFGLANKIKTLLSNMGVDSQIITGSLKDRVYRSADADFGICLHADSFQDDKINGFHTAHYPNSIKGEMLAHFIANSMSHVGIKENRAPEARGDLYMLKKTDFPCILVEAGFLTNEEDCKKLHKSAWQWKVATAIAYGVLTYEEI